MKKLVDEVEHYFELFSRKDLEGVSRKFSDDIFVQDWDIYAQGKGKVIEVNKGIFDSVDTVSVNIREFYQQDLVTICLIDVEINGQEIRRVIDIIKFNENYKIKEISAYKQ